MGVNTTATELASTYSYDDLEVGGIYHIISGYSHSTFRILRQIDNKLIVRYVRLTTHRHDIQPEFYRTELILAREHHMNSNDQTVFKKGPWLGEIVENDDAN